MPHLISIVTKLNKNISIFCGLRITAVVQTEIKIKWVMAGLEENYSTDRQAELFFHYATEYADIFVYSCSDRNEMKHCSVTNQPCPLLFKIRLFR